MRSPTTRGPALFPFAAFLVASLTTTAVAQPSAESGGQLDDPERPLGPGGAQLAEPARLGWMYFEFGGSIAGPAGWIFIGVGLLPADWLSVRLGGGAGATGLQGALSVAVHAPLTEHFALGLEASTSVGPYSYVPCRFDFYSTRTCDTYRWDLAHWVYGAVSFRWLFGRRWWVRPQVGYGRVVNPGAARCMRADDDSPCDSTPSDVDELGLVSVLGAAFGGVSFAYTFDP